MPAKFRRRITGMGGGEELVGDELISAQLDWIEDALDACDSAERAALREAKETVNRRLDMFIYMHSLQTATFAGWMNFEGLRLDSGADPTIQVLAQKCFAVYREAEPERMIPGHWHLPFIEHDDLDNFDAEICLGENDEVLQGLINLSAARSAHLSFNDLETGMRMTRERAFSIATKLRDSAPLHASPFEHQATPDHRTIIGSGPQAKNVWQNFNQWGNLPFWRQARKMIPNEAIAPLPKGYEV